MKIKLTIEIPDGKLCNNKDEQCKYYRIQEVSVGSDTENRIISYMSMCGLFLEILAYKMTSPRGYVKCNKCLQTIEEATYPV